MEEKQFPRPERRKFTFIYWRPPEERPQEDSFVLMQLVDVAGIYVEYGTYENGRFVFHYFNGKELILAEECVLGWSYLPIWFFERP